jgi:hypothetical protein
MKPLILTHTCWIHQLCDSWRRCNAEATEYYFPVIPCAKSPQTRQAETKRLLEAIDRVKPDLILDVNGVGILPMDKDGSRWLPTETGIPWCVWWWDRPRYHAYLEPNLCPAWVHTLQQPAMHLFLWDEPLSREYSVWLQKPVHWLPTATHAGMFWPSRETYDPSRIQYDACFLGEFLEAPASAPPEINAVANERFFSPQRTVFEIAERLGLTAPALMDLLVSEFKKPERGFSAEYFAWVQQTNHCVAKLRRTSCLEEILASFPKRLFIGQNWPPQFQVETLGNGNPAVLSSWYGDALLCPDPGNGQSHTGTALRSYEIMSSGGVLVCRRYPDFDPTGSDEGRVYLAFERPDELLEIRQRLIENPDLAAGIRSEARRYVAERHTWLHRLAYLVRVALSETTHSYASAPEANAG